MGLAAQDVLGLPGCARLNLLDVGDRRAVRLSGGNVQAVRVLSTTREGGDLGFGLGAGTLGLAKMASCGLDALDFTGTQYIQAALAARPRYSASRLSPSRFLCAVVYSTTFNAAGFPVLACRYTGTAATSQWLMLHRHTGLARPATSMFEATTTTEKLAATAVGATGNDGLPHVLFTYSDGAPGAQSVFTQLDGTARQSAAIAGLHDPGAATVMQIGASSTAALFAQAKIGAVVWGNSENPTQAVASILRWARSRWRVA